MVEFGHEKLEVYGVSIDFVAAADDIVAGLPRGRAYIADQLRRAATSIVLNIAEGAGEFRPLEKARFYRTSLRSATECAAMIEVCHRIGVVESALRMSSRVLLDRIVGMLTRMIRSMEDRERAGERERA